MERPAPTDSDSTIDILWAGKLLAVGNLKILLKTWKALEGLQALGILGTLGDFGNLGEFVGFGNLVATVGGNLAQHSRCWHFRHRDVWSFSLDLDLLLK